ncbi:MAG: pyrroline-5-carboxylate reductase [Thiomonas delicata]
MMSASRTKITLVGGGGFMGEAIATGLVRSDSLRSREITLSDPNERRLHHLQKSLDVSLRSDNVSAIQDTDVVFLCIKPTHLQKVAIEIKGALPGHALVVSIVAGADLTTVSTLLDHHAVVRVMPNLPSQICAGFLPWFAATDLDATHATTAKELLGALGRAPRVDDEKYIDLLTSVSGAGPAFTFLFIESLTDAAVHLGLPRHLAQELVIQTIEGSARLASSSTDSPNQLRAKVTSPGGVTAESIAVLEERGFRVALDRAAHAGYHKTIELQNGIRSQSGSHS